MSYPKKAVLIIRPGALGDTLMLVPALVQLGSEAEIILVGREPGLGILKPYVSHAINFEGSGWHQLFLERRGGPPLLYSAPVDQVVAFFTAPSPRVRENLDFFFPHASLHIFPAYPDKDSRVHVACYLMECLSKAGLPLETRLFERELSTRPLLSYDSPEVQKNGIILHPGSGGKSKNFPPKFWIRLAKALKGKDSPVPGEKIFLLLGPAEEGLKESFDGHFSSQQAEMIFLPEKGYLLSLLKNASVFIGHDSGVTHLSAMLGTWTIALFKNTSSYQWGPMGPRVQVIEGDLESQYLLNLIMKAITSTAQK